MLHRKLVGRTVGSLLAGLGFLAVLGCSDDGMGQRYPVSGTVKYNGEPVAKARISFVPKEAGGRGSFGEVVDGTFSSVTTLTDGDGALPGDYRISIDDREVDSAKIKADAEALAKKHGLKEIGQVPQELSAKARNSAKGRLPGKYQTAETSKLEAKVEAKSNSFDFTLDDK